jgi:2-(3-amino-3-carboxypropyl)histidine synthase
MIDFHIAEVVSFIQRREADLVALQFPEGLKVHAMGLAEELERRTGCKCIILGDPCYGACDVSVSYRDVADALVHFGHTPMPDLDVGEDVFFVEVRLEYGIEDLLPLALPRMKKRVGLVTTPQHLQWLPRVQAWLRSKDIDGLIGEGDARLKHPGQVLGCNVTSASSIAKDVDQFLFIGSGDFHPLAVAIETGKEVIVLDPLMREVRDVGELKDRVLRQRYASIALAQEAGSFGILISTKPGQRRRVLAMRLRSLIEEKGRRASIIAMDNVAPDQLLAFKVDAFVSTACPRIAIDDALRYKRPMLTPIELEVALGLRAWEDYAFDSILAGSEK